MNRPLAGLTLLLALTFPGHAALAQDAPAASETSYDGFSLRGIGPAINGGRIADIDIHPDNRNVWYVAVGSGGVWKTENAGTTWQPIFDGQGAYSIGDVTIDRSAPNIVWVGTGENVGGRHVGFGDGVYKSTDGGRTWRNMGLEGSEHVSTILVHPNDSDVVWVAAQGPLWSPGGDRGLYRTTDGGETWEKVLDGGNEWTGVTDIVMDPRDPDRLYAATWQRHRTVAAYLGGGPGSGIHKSEDGGETWTELRTGLPSGNMGKIGLAVSPQDPAIVYAAIELDRTTGGVWKSEDRGESWRKMSDAVSGGTGPHYYQELYASPHQHGRLYLVSNYMLVSDDHGATFERMNVRNKHVDDHAVAFNDDPNYVIVGTDGGLFETFDLTQSWRFVRNLPVMQYYKISVDDAEPFYHVFGGTQDNGSNGGPSRTDMSHGIRNADWFKTLGADGHESATEPGNPDIIYASTQQGGIHRVDRITGEQVFIQPQAREGEPFERFNWDAPLEVSFHDPARIYHASYRVWRSDDRGNSWTPISGDLTRSQERLALPIMGGTQSWDNAWDVGAMSNYNTVTSLGESPFDEDLIYAGTDDGLLWVTENGGQEWRRIDVGSIRGVPETAFVNDIKVDLHDPSTVYVALDNHKYGDFSPYLIKSTDRGRSWRSIAGDLPERHLVWRVVQDHVDPELMFAATEFGIFFTVDGGREWMELGGGVPTISFRDIVIQREHEDVVAGSFGRGIFVLDDYAPLRHVDDELLDREAHLFDTRTAYWYQPKSVSGSQGDNEFTADNPPFGAVFTYYLKDGYQSLESERQARERELERGDIPWPGWDALEAEMREQGPTVQVVVRDENGTVVNRVAGPTSAGFHRVSWELDHAPATLVGLGEEVDIGGSGFMALPGTYTAELIKVEDGEVMQLAAPVEFGVVPLRDAALPRATPSEVESFRAEVEEFSNDLTRTSNLLTEQIETVEALQTALNRADAPDPALNSRLYRTRLELLELRERLQGSEARDEVGERSPTTPTSRLWTGYRGLSTTYGPTELHRRTIQAGQAELVPIREDIERYAETVVPELRRAVDGTGAPPVEGGR